jgi:hypothetical protein
MPETLLSNLQDLMVAKILQWKFFMFSLWE